MTQKMVKYISQCVTDYAFEEFGFGIDLKENSMKTIPVIFKEFVPEDSIVVSRPLNDQHILILRTAERGLAAAIHKDPRTAEIYAVQDYLATILPHRLQLPIVARGGWSYGIQVAAVRYQAILNASLIWAWDFLQKHGRSIELVDPLEDFYAQTLDQLDLLPEQIRLWKAPISFFESEAGILQLELRILAAELAPGQWWVSRQIFPIHQVDPMKMVVDLWWSSQTVAHVPLSEIHQLKKCQTWIGAPWPGLRVNYIRHYDMSALEVGLPGHLWCASVEDDSLESHSKNTNDRVTFN